MFVIIWEFEPRAGSEREFVAAYGPEGVWAQFFKDAEGYLGTELLRATGNKQRYLTIDRWISEAAREALLRERQAEYEKIDRDCAELTENERPLDNFTTENTGG
jgi:heme-degrading monooxygenase HmoA